MTASGGHPEAEAHMTHALDPKFKGARRQCLVLNVYTLYGHGMIVQYLVLEVAQLAVVAGMVMNNKSHPH